MDALPQFNDGGRKKGPYGPSSTKTWATRQEFLSATRAARETRLDQLRGGWQFEGAPGGTLQCDAVTALSGPGAERSPRHI